MRVILSVFECNPYNGSDAYVGWSYAISLAREHQVYALTREENRADISKYLEMNQDPAHQNIKFIFLKRSKFFSKYLYRVNRYCGFLGSYYAWQYSAYKAAKRICAEHAVDVCHHVSIADFRVVGYLRKCGRPFVFGPVGGGQDTPACLRHYIKGHEGFEIFRSLINWVCIRAPGYKKALQHADVVYISNEETLNYIGTRFKKIPEHFKLLTELCIDEQYLTDRAALVKEEKNVVHIVVAGRLIYRKGISLLLDALKYVETSEKYVVDIFGDGEEKDNLIKQSQENALENRVCFHGKVSYERMQENYKAADIFVLPSLRETTGTAVFEAMANKLPVIALRQNGVKNIVGQDSGILIDIQSREQVLHDMAGAIECLVEDRKLRISLGEKGYQKICKEYTWMNRTKEMTEVYKNLCAKEVVQ